MKPPPKNPAQLSQRVFSAMLEDMFDMGAGKSRSFERVDAIQRIVSQRNER